MSKQKDKDNSMVVAQPEIIEPPENRGAKVKHDLDHPKIWEIAKNLAADGLSNDGIASYFGMSRTTLWRKVKDFSTVR